MSQYPGRLRIECDWNRNARFDSLDADISAWVQNVTWRTGFSEPLQRVAAPAQMDLYISNHDDAFTPNHPSQRFDAINARGMLIRIGHDGPSGLIWHIVLKLASAAFPRDTSAKLKIVATDWHQELMNTLFDFPYTENTDTGTAIEAAFSEHSALSGYPDTRLWWVLDADPLGTGTRLPDYYTPLGAGSDLISIGTGQTTFEYVGDNLDKGAGLALASFIDECCAAEGFGRFRLECNTTAGLPLYTFYSRHALTEGFDSSTLLTVDGSVFENVATSWGWNLVNRCKVIQTPRKLGTPASVIGTLNQVIPIPGKGQRSFTLRFRDPVTGLPCSAKDVIAPAVTTDWTGNLAEDGSGADYTYNLFVSWEQTISSMEMTVSNSATGTVYLTLLQVRGTPITALEPVTSTQSNAQSIKTYGLVEQAIQIAGVGDLEFAESLAGYVANVNAEPRLAYQSVTFSFVDGLPEALQWFMAHPYSIDHALRILDPALPGGYADYWIAGQQHTVTGEQWSVTYLVEDYSRYAGFFKVGDPTFAALDNTTRLAF